MYYTINNLRHDVRIANERLLDSGSTYFLKEQGRNGRQAVDIYRISEDGTTECREMLASGSSRECGESLRAFSRNYKGYTFPQSPRELKRAQAKTALEIYGVDFSADYYTLPFNHCDMLAQWAKRTRYRKPRNANGSLGRYFFAHLQKLKGE